MRKNRIHTAEFRLKIVKEKLRGSSARALSSKWKLSTSLIRTWVDHHQSSGALGLLPKSHRCYASEFKRTVVEAYTNKGLSLWDCCRQFNIRIYAIMGLNFFIIKILKYFLASRWINQSRLTPSHRK